MKKKLTKRMLLGVLAAAMFGLSANNAEAQTFTNTGVGTYNATCGGVIRFKAATNAAATPPVQAAFIPGDDNMGKITVPTAKAIPGIVEWASTGTTQTVKAYKYQSLLLSGASVKSVESGVIVTGEACSSFLAGYDLLGTYPYAVVRTGATQSGPVSYLDDGGTPGTFNYAGGNAQAIFPTYDGTGGATVVNPYHVVSLSGGGTATVREGDNVTANVINSAGAITGATPVDATILSIVGNLTISGTGPAASTIAGDVQLVAGVAAPTPGYGTLTTGAGDVTISGITTTADNTTITVGGEGDLTFAGNLTLAGDLVVPDGTSGSPRIVNLDGTAAIAASGTINIGASDSLIVSNTTFTNAGDGNNLTFDCASNVVYDSPTANQPILPTLDADDHRYGNLILREGNKIGGVAGTGAGLYYDVAVCNNFSLAGGNLDMYKSGTNSANLIMNAPQTGTDFATNNGVMAYTGLAEVVGAVVRKTDGTAKTYTFNNSATTIALAANVTAPDPNPNTNPTSMTMTVIPGATLAALPAPAPIAINNYQAGKDVNRKVNLAYAPSANVFEMTSQVAYKYEEGPKGATATPAYWDAAGGSFTQTSVRLYETSALPNPNGSREKIGTGVTPTRGTAAAGTSFGYVSLASIAGTGSATLPNNIDKFASGNDFVLSAGPTTFYSIADGRWSNPNTWDEGTTPTSIDNVELRTTVYAGIVNLFSTGNAIPEKGLPNTTDGMAKTITIADKTALPATNYPAFLLGNEDNGANFVFKTTAVGAGDSPLTIINNNTTVPTGLAAFEVTTPTARTGIADKGLYTTNPGFSGIWVTPWNTGATPGIPALQTNQIENKGTVNNEGIIEVGQ